MPIGSAISRSGTANPVTAFQFVMKKSAYLKYTRKASEDATDKARKTFAARLPLKRSIRSPKT